MGAIFSKNGHRRAQENTQLVSTGTNGRPSNGNLRRRIPRTQTPTASASSTNSQKSSLQNFNIPNAPLPTHQSAQNARRNRPLYLETKRAGRKMVLRSVPIDNDAQLLDLLSRAKTLYMDWKRRKQIIRRQRARRAVRFGFLGIRFALGAIGLGGLLGLDVPDVPLLDGDPGVELEDGTGLEEDYDEDDNQAIVEDGVYEPIDQQAQTGGHDADNDPSIPPEVKAAFLAANILGAMTEAGRYAREDLAARWNVRTLRANIRTLRQHTAEQILPHFTPHHGIDIRWVKVNEI